MGRRLTMRTVRVGDLFNVRSGDVHAADKELAPGETPLVSCGDVNHGLVGFYQIPDHMQYVDALTVAYNGAPLTAKYRPYRFGAKDDIGVLIPVEEVSERYLLYVAAAINAERWRYSYGRKCFKRKLQAVKIRVPQNKSWADEFLRQTSLDKRPRLASSHSSDTQVEGWAVRRLDDLFYLRRGSFHSIRDLAAGPIATVSRTEKDNGVVGYLEQPDGSVLYPPGRITVSTVSGDAFVQTQRFQATDNVVVCVPRGPMRPASAYFVAAAINSQKWRYSYGRQPYPGKLSAVTVRLPWRGDTLDEDAIEQIVASCSYWQFVSRLSQQ